MSPSNSPSSSLLSRLTPNLKRVKNHTSPTPPQKRNYQPKNYNKTWVREQNRVAPEGNNGATINTRSPSGPSISPEPSSSLLDRMSSPNAVDVDGFLATLNLDPMSQMPSPLRRSLSERESNNPLDTSLDPVANPDNPSSPIGDAQETGANNEVSSVSAPLSAVPVNSYEKTVKVKVPFPFKKRRTDFLSNVEEPKTVTLPSFRPASASSGGSESEIARLITITGTETESDSGVDSTVGFSAVESTSEPSSVATTRSADKIGDDGPLQKKPQTILQLSPSLKGPLTYEESPPTGTPTESSIIEPSTDVQRKIFSDNVKALLLPILLRNTSRRVPEDVPKSTVHEILVRSKIHGRELLDEVACTQLVDYAKKVKQQKLDMDPASRFGGMRMDRIADVEMKDVSGISSNSATRTFNDSRASSSSLGKQPPTGPRAMRMGTHSRETSQRDRDGTPSSSQTVARRGTERHSSNRDFSRSPSPRRTARRPSDFDNRSPRRRSSRSRSPIPAPHTRRRSIPRRDLTPPDSRRTAIQPPATSVPVSSSNAIDSMTMTPLAKNTTNPIAPPPITLPVPGLWSVQIGSDTPDILNITLDVNTATAKQWGILDRTPDGQIAVGTASENKPAICLELRSLQVNMAGKSPSSDAMAHAMTGLDVTWPTQGQLIVQVNEGQPWGRTWLPNHLKPTSPSLQITEHVREGPNTIRLIQLADMSKFAFVLHASMAPGEQNSSKVKAGPPVDLSMLLGQASNADGSLSFRATACTM